MKIGFWGNVNNYPFSLAFEYKKMGIDVIFIFDAENNNKLYKPEYMYQEISYPYPKWIINNQNNKPFLYKLLCFAFPQIFMRKTISKLNTCDAVFLNEYGHSLQPYLKKNIPSISIFSGSDLDVLANKSKLKESALISNNILNFFLFWLKYLIVKKQYYNHVKGIKNAFIVSYFPKMINVKGNELLEEIKSGQKYIKFSRHHIVLNTIKYSEPIKKNKGQKVILFCVARFIWKTPLPSGYSNFENKRNDIMVKGIAKFYKKTGIEIELHLVEKGIHIDETKALLVEEGIDHMVTWHKEMSQLEVIRFYQYSDIVFDQLGEQIIGGGYQAMAVGRPLIANARPEVFDELIHEESPICHSRNSDDVCKWLEILVLNESERINIGKKSRAYVLKHFDIKEEALYYLNQLKQKINVN